MLLENTTTAADAVVQLFEALGLRGSPTDYALEERNIVTGGIYRIHFCAEEEGVKNNKQLFLSVYHTCYTAVIPDIVLMQLLQLVFK